MGQDPFELVEKAFQADGTEAVFDLLIRRSREERNPQALFGAHVMRVRHRLRLPLIETEPVLDLPPDQREIYDAAFRDAAREAGTVCLEAGDIPSAWIYFKAIGEKAPVAEAIEKVTDGDNLDRVIEIAFQEGANPRKGFELILEHRGICSAITWYGANRDYSSRQECLRLLVRTLHSQVATAIKQTIAATEGAAPDTGSIMDLIAGRDWLFEGMSSYTDSTHLSSILRYAPELEDKETLRMALELAEYGRRLDPMFHFRGDPPFEEIYADHAVYLRALLGEEVDAAIAHLRSKASATGDPTPAEVLIDLLVRLGRTAEAIQASAEYFPQGSYIPQGCPSVLQLCQMAADYQTLRGMAREREDLLGFAAAIIQAGGSERRPE